MVGVSADGQSGGRPGRVLTVAALAAAAVTVGLVGSLSELAFGVSAVGGLALLVGLTNENRRMAAIGAAALLASVLVAGVTDPAPARILPATAAAILAWVFGLGGLAAAVELRGGSTERAEVRHVSVTAGVGAMATGAVYGLERSITVGVSPAAIVLLLLAVVALALAVRGGQ